MKAPFPPIDIRHQIIFPTSGETPAERMNEYHHMRSTYHPEGPLPRFHHITKGGKLGL
jgi:hypothetical protein